MRHGLPLRLSIRFFVRLSSDAVDLTRPRELIEEGDEASID